MTPKTIASTIVSVLSAMLPFIVLRLPAVVLGANDLAVMAQTPGSLRVQAYAALMSNQAALTGTAK